MIDIVYFYQLKRKKLSVVVYSTVIVALWEIFVGNKGEEVWEQLGPVASSTSQNLLGEIRP